MDLFAILLAGQSLPHAADAGWKGEETCELLQDNDYVRAFKCTFKPGQGHERHYHNAHFGYILEGGKMEITDEGGTREQETPAGVSWWSNGVDWHEPVNIGDTTTSYIIIEPKTGTVPAVMPDETSENSD
ncbi:MAG: cupin domain-containing protein [Pseudomonadota bacterium]